MFSKACEYGIRALTVIAEAGKENKKIVRHRKLLSLSLLRFYKIW